MSVGAFSFPFFLKCPLALLGMRCPTCGLGHALLELFQGNFRSALTQHPLVFVFLIVSLAFLIALLTKPSQLRSCCAQIEAWVMKHRALSYVLLLFYIIWGLSRANPVV